MNLNTNKERTISNEKKEKVFLSGDNLPWKASIVPMLAKEVELIEDKDSSTVEVFVITPDVVDVFTVAEVIKSAHTEKDTIFAYVDGGSTSSTAFSPVQLESLEKVAEIVRELKGKCTTSLEEVARLLNQKIN